MKKEDIELWDWERIIVGNAPGAFMFEVFLRTIFTFILLLTILRLLGKKMNGQLTHTETAVMITLGAIVSIPMQTPERGLLIGMVALFCILIFQKAINWSSVKSSKVESLAQGRLSILVRDGVMDVEAMARAGVSKQYLFAELRRKEYYNLGKIKRLYFEACGMFNAYGTEEKKSGLALYPPHNEELMDSSEKDPDHVACKNCGFVTDSPRQSQRCPHCNEQQWITAIF
jgi:uncharacterized membrane protein YcaP (DUF421 family)